MSLGLLVRRSAPQSVLQRSEPLLGRISGSQIEAAGIPRSGTSARAQPARTLSTKNNSIFFNSNLLTSADDDRGRGVHPGSFDQAGHRTRIWKRLLPTAGKLDIPPSGHDLDSVYTSRLRQGKPEYGLPPVDGRPTNLTVSLGLSQGLVAHSDIPPQWRDSNREHDALYRFEDARGNKRVEWLYIRPGVEEFLKRLQKVPEIEVCLWTSLPSWRALPMLDYLDPEGDLLQHTRFWFSTTPAESRSTGRITFVKDLRILDRPMERSVLVDGRGTAGVLNPSNVLPLVSLQPPSKESSWSEEALAEDLMKSAELLEQLAKDPSLNVQTWLPDQIESSRPDLAANFQGVLEEQGTMRMLCNHRNELIVGGSTGPQFYFESEKEAIPA